MNSRASDTAKLLRGRRILIVGRDYYFYTREIVSELTAGYGASVNFHPIEPPGFLYRLLQKIGVGSSRWLGRYHRKLIRRAQRAPPEIVLFVQVHQIGHLVKEYREAFSSARFVLYYWDSLKTHDYRGYLRYFDAVFSFDDGDCKEVAGLEYLPLFYCERFRSLRQQGNPAYDISFVGVAVSVSRYERLVELRKWARTRGVSFFDYVVVSPFLYAKMLLRGRRLRDVHFKSLNEEALLRIYGNSRSVLDLPNNVQSGYTMRTFESLGSHRKLITANQNIVNEDFYTPESVFVIDAQREFPDRSFIYSRAEFSSALERYSLRNWILVLLGPVLRSGKHSQDRCDSQGGLIE